LCPGCGSNKTVKNGKQGSSHRYLCRKCEHSFSIYHGVNPSNLWIEHIDGVGFRRLGDENILSGSQTYARVIAELDQMPKNDWLTKTLCDLNRCEGILILDGKYVAVKGFERKIPFLYGIDYLTHDIIHEQLCLAEDEAAFSQYFQKLKDLGYNLKIVVADDRAGIKQALNKVFSYARLQLCQNHFLENIRQLLKVRSVPTYQHFFNSLKLHVFTNAKTDQEITEGLEYVKTTHAGKSFLLHNILADIENRRNDLFAYLHFKNCPNNTNLIELYNSHLNGRLKTIKGFQNLTSAKRWLNAWVIRRRTKKLTDCEDKFKYLNKHCSLEFTIKKQATWPEQLKTLGINKIYFYEKSEIIH
jgi:ribosome modulation factor